MPFSILLAIHFISNQFPLSHFYSLAHLLSHFPSFINKETLCNERSYPFNDKEAIREDYRVPLIKSKIQSEITKNGIICLQEVTQKLSGDLHKVFNNNGYYMINGLYGRDFNGNMGVALAFSTKKYDLVESAIITVGSTKKLPRDPELSWFRKIINR